MQDHVFAEVAGLLEPRSVAVIGASDRSGNLGGDTVHRLVRFGFPCPVWAVNPNATTVKGVPCFPAVADLPEPPELIIMALPTAAIADTMRASAARASASRLPADLPKWAAKASHCRRSWSQPVASSAAGLLAVDLRSLDEVTAGLHRLEERAQGIGVRLDGVYVQKMQAGGVGLLIAVFRDRFFGTMISCGSGGGMTELIDDVVTARALVTEAVAADMLSRLRMFRHARDERGPLDPAAPAAFIAGLSRLGAGAPWKGFTFEVNPIKWNRDGVTAVDGLLVIDQA